tara:strand:+ start:167 stop:502 length:336 start_codon:yes stop_codon:yes gene_type:complete
MNPRDKINNLINQYLSNHPELECLDEEYMHPSVLALHEDIKPWMIDELGSAYELWKLLLDAAKEWFPDKNKSKLGRLFCNRFEIEGCTFWNGIDEYKPLTREYHEWRGINR